MSSFSIRPENFSIRLPQSIRLGPGRSVHTGQQGMPAVHGPQGITVVTNDTAAAELSMLLGGYAIESASIRSREATATVQALARRGHLSTPGHDSSASTLSGFDAIGLLTDKVNELGVLHLGNLPATERFMSGGCSEEQIIGWFRSTFKFTSAAARHIGPVLQHRLSPTSQAAWVNLLADEITHWKIYRPAFSHYGMDVDVEWQARPSDATEMFLSKLTSAANAGEVEYLACVLFIEQAPTASRMDDDHLYRPMLNHYRVPRAVLKPLWWHATENLRAGHTYMPAGLLSRIGEIPVETITQAVKHLDLVIRAVRDWHDEMWSSEAD